LLGPGGRGGGGERILPAVPCLASFPMRHFFYSSQYSPHILSLSGVSISYTRNFLCSSRAFPFPRTTLPHPATPPLMSDGLTGSPAFIWVLFLTPSFPPFLPPSRNHLFVPGPVNMHERVQKAMDRCSQNHRDPWFPKFFTGCLEDTKYLFRTTRGTPFIYPGTGTGGWEAALTNCLSPGDKVVTFR